MQAMRRFDPLGVEEQGAASEESPPMTQNIIVAQPALRTISTMKVQVVSHPRLKLVGEDVSRKIRYTTVPWTAGLLRTGSGSSTFLSSRA